MGFPNVDIFLVSKFQKRFKGLASSDGTFIINDLFDDLDREDIAAVSSYVRRKMFTTDLRDRADEQVYILPHFPLLDMPLPQIGVSLGNDTTAGGFLGDITEESAEVLNSTGERIGWDVQKGYLSSATYQIDIAAATKLETIWLSRFVQRFILEEQENLAQAGVLNIDISLQDMRVDQSAMPCMVFARQVNMKCTLANAWRKRLALFDIVGDPEWQTEYQ